MDHRLHRVLRRFSGGLAHELSNFMNALSLGRQLLKQQVNSPEAQESLENLTDLEQQMGELQERLDLLCLPEDDRMERVVLRDVIEQFASTADPELDYSVNESGDPMQVRVDRESMHQLLSELVTNASRASEDDPVRIEAHPEDRSAVLTVLDTGPGFAEDLPGNPFDPFVTSDDHQAGLGLTIAEQIVSGHGGELLIDTDRTDTAVTARIPRTNPDETHATG